jgi:hypothetical protein
VAQACTRRHRRRAVRDDATAARAIRDRIALDLPG